MNSIEEGQPKVNLAQIFKEVMSGLPQTNWWVVTGGPSTGKTTLLELLSNYGYNTKPEAARVFIDQELEKGRSIQQIRGDEKRFQEEVLNLKYETDEATNENETVIWDRGTDGDSIAYYPDEISYGPANSMKSYDHHLGEPAVIEIRRRYKGIFILDRLSSYESDYARTESNDLAIKIHERIGVRYRMLGYSPIRVPVFSSNPLVSVERRAQFIVDQIRSVDPNIPELKLDPNRPNQPELSINI